jgi:hypothetical protein
MVKGVEHPRDARTMEIKYPAAVLTPPASTWLNDFFWSKRPIVAINPIRIAGVPTMLRIIRFNISILSLHFLIFFKQNVIF